MTAVGTILALDMPPKNREILIQNIRFIDKSCSLILEFEDHDDFSILYNVLRI